MGCIYKITNIINDKSYIGLSINTAENRWKRHLYDTLNKKDNFAVHHAIRKYGEMNFKIEIICKCNKIESLRILEIYYIKKFKSNDRKYGYNMTIGGEGAMGRKCSKETRKKISESQKGKKLTEEHKRKLSESHKGMKHTEETKKKISEGGSIRMNKPEEKEKMSKLMKGNNYAVGNTNRRGVKLTQEQKQKISEANKGYKHTEEWKIEHTKRMKKFNENLKEREKVSKRFKGIKFSKEHKKKISEAHIRRNKLKMN
jgi:group I intron endonuclease